MGHHPESTEDHGDVDSKELEETARVVLLHRLHHHLDVLVRDLGCTNTIQVKYGSPALNLTRDHSLIDDIVQEEVGGCDELIDAVL